MIQARWWATWRVSLAVEWCIWQAMWGLWRAAGKERRGVCWQAAKVCDRWSWQWHRTSYAARFCQLRSARA